jgi:tungstate transport system ATP-binding protein
MTKHMTQHMAQRDSILPLIVEDVAYAVAGRALVQDVSLRIEARSRIALLGPNGAGKSVLLRLLHGLLAPTRGRVAWASADAARAQAMVFQRPMMLRRSAVDNVAFALRVAGAATSVAPSPVRGYVCEAALRALDRVGLAALADRPARLCSGGEQQRIAIARAWAVAPQVLFLDEPTASLDPAATRSIEDSIAAMYQTGTTMVMATHDLGQARRFADRVLFMHEGRIVEDSPAEIFFRQPRAPLAAAFLKGEIVC